MSCKKDSIRIGFKWALLAGTILSSTTVFAQGVTDEIVITATPIRDSQAAAIESKKNAFNVVDVLAADTIGRFPDQNLADSLGRIPGLAIERDQGQARFINFRGAPFRYSKIGFDGIDVLGAEDGRIPRFDSFPSVITSKIEINKAITPDLPGEATVGFINIETFKPFDRDGFSLSGEAGYGRQALGGVDVNKYNVRASYSNDKFGLVGFWSHNLRGRITDNREYKFEDLDGDGIDESIDNLDFRSYRGEREDNAYGGRVEFRPTPDSSIFFSSLFSEFIDREERMQFDFDFAPVPLASSGYIDTIAVTRSLGAPIYTNSTFTNTLGYDALIGDWEIEARANYTETENPTTFPFPQSYGGLVGASYDVSDIENPQLFLTQPGVPGSEIDVNTLNYGFGDAAILFVQTMDTEAWKGKLDAQRDIDLFDLTTRVKFGGQYDTREAIGGTGLDVDFSLFSAFDLNSFVTDNLWDQDFDNTIQGRNFDNHGFDRVWRGARGGFNVPSDPEDIVKIEEDVIALYGMGTTEFDWGSIVYGVRAERTKATSSGTLADGGIESPVVAENSYWNVLPSLHFNFDLRDDMKLRVSGSSGISRPRYSEMRASQDVNVSTLEIEGGNPFLDPEVSRGADIAFEWYFAEASLFSVGGYYRAIDNVIYPGATTVDGSTFAPGLIAPGTPTVLSSFFNGEQGRLKGFEANFIGHASDFLPSFFDGFGFSGNVTLVESSFVAPELGNQRFDLPGTSDLVYNLSLFYENHGLSTRLNYQFRDDWLSTTENSSLTEYWAATKRLDASVRYMLPMDVAGAGVTLALNGNNLTDARDVRYINRRETPNQVEGFGRRWVASIRVDY